MKKSLSIVLSTVVVLFLLAFNSTAQEKASKKSNDIQVGSATSEMPAWEQMDSFNKLFAISYNAAKKGDLKPIRENSNQLVLLSYQWGKSEYPAINDNVEMRTLIGEFSDRCEELERFINAGRSNDEIIFELEKLNNSLKEISALRDSQGSEKK